MVFVLFLMVHLIKWIAITTIAGTYGVSGGFILLLSLLPYFVSLYSLLVLLLAVGGIGGISKIPLLLLNLECPPIRVSMVCILLCRSKCKLWYQHGYYEYGNWRKRDDGRTCISGKSKHTITIPTRQYLCKMNWFFLCIHAVFMHLHQLNIPDFQKIYIKQLVKFSAQINN